MSFNNYLLIILSLVIISCGLKTKPRPPKDTKLPSLVKKYSYEVKKVDDSKKKKEKK